MDISKISAGKELPNDLNVLIEIPANGDPVKYEIDKESGAIFVDRFLFTPMRYPANYGFVPNTLSDDGDPIDVLVIGHCPVVAGSVMRARPIGVLMMEDEAGQDEKVVAVPHDKLWTGYTDVQDVMDLPQIIRDQIQHFFEHYKDLEKGKWVKVTGWGDKAKAGEMIMAAYERAQK